MADQRVNIKIGTTYNGAGADAAVSGLGKMSKVTNKVAGSVSRLVGKFDDFDGAAGRTVSQIARLIGALTAGGGFGFAITGVTLLVGAFKAASDEAKKAREEIEKQKFEFAKRGIEEYQKSVDSLAASLDKVTKSQATFNNTLAAIDTNKSNIAATQALIAGEKGGTDVTRAAGRRDATAIAQAQNIKNAETAAENARKRWSAANKVSDAQNAAVESLRKSVESAQKNLDTLASNEARQAAAERERWAVPIFGEGTNAVQEHQEKIKNAAIILAKAQEALAKAEDEQRVKTNAANQAYNEFVKTQEALKATQTKAQLENIRADNALNEAKKKEEEKRKEEEEKAFDEQEKARAESVKETWAQVTREKERNDRFRDEERMEKQLREEIAKESKLREDLSRATEDLKNAQYEYANACRNAANAANNSTWQGWAGNNGIPPDQITGNGINGKDRYDPRNNASINDAGYNERKQEGYARNARSQGHGLSPKDVRARNRIYDKLASGQELTGPEKELLDEINARDPEKQRDAAEKAADKAAEKVKDAIDAQKTAEQQMRNNVAKIVTLLDKLGLK